jgi:Ca2+:H+ antiporter
MKIKYLYVFIPVSILFYVFNIKGISFLTAVLSIVYLSSSICYYTNALSVKLGDKIGGMINATTANIPELLICFFALKNGMIDLVKAGVIGSVISNILLVEGASIFLGGLKYSEQKFNKNVARTNLGLLFIALTGIITASIFNQVAIKNTNIEKLSFGIAIVLIIVYLLGLVFSLITHRNLFIVHDSDEEAHTAETISVKKALYMLIIISLIIAFESEILVDSTEFIISHINISQTFIGIIIVPLVGNVSESSSAIYMALKDKMNVCIEIAVGSGMQIALFVIPLLTIIGTLIGNPVNLVYNYYHITCLILSIGLSFFVFQDGKTYWIEGTILLASYFIILLGYFFM